MGSFSFNTILSIMTNEQAKQEAIKKAYGEHWERVKNKVRASSDARISGYSLPQDVGMPSHSIVQYDWKDDDWRPMELRGIEDNNGWIRIEPDGSNLPESGLYKVVSMHYSEPLISKFAKGNNTWIPINTEDRRIISVTHYKPIKEELKPVY